MVQAPTRAPGGRRTPWAGHTRRFLGEAEGRVGRIATFIWEGKG